MHALIYGDEPYQKKQAIDYLREKIKNMGYSDRDIIEISKGTDLGLLQNTANQFSLFSKKRAIEVYFSETQFKKNISESLIQLVNYNAPDLFILFIFNKPSANTLKSDWFIKLQKNATESIKTYPLNPLQLKNWIQKQTQALKIKLLKKHHALLIEKTQGNLLLTAQILDKLALICPQQTIQDHVFSSVLYENPQFSLFDL